MNRAELADFLRARRGSLDPTDVGLAAGPRRRAPGLRREEVAVLAQMSTDYYTRLEQGRGPQPSEQILASLAVALRLVPEETEHLYRLAGRLAPPRPALADRISPGLARVLASMEDTPVELISVRTETLVQTPPAVALLGDRSTLTGLDRSSAYRWFARPEARELYPEEDHAHLSLAFASDLRRAAALLGDDAAVAAVIAALTESSAEFRDIWAKHEVTHHLEHKRIVHPSLGVIAVQCQRLHDPATHQALLVFTATPGTEDAERLRLLSVLGAAARADASRG